MEIILSAITVIVGIPIFLLMVFLFTESCNDSDMSLNPNYKQVDIYNQEGDYEYSYYELKDTK